MQREPRALFCQPLFPRTYTPNIVSMRDSNSTYLPLKEVRTRRRPLRASTGYAMVSAFEPSVYYQQKQAAEFCVYYAKSRGACVSVICEGRLLHSDMRTFINTANNVPH